MEILVGCEKLVPWYGHFLEHLPDFATIGALLRQFALDAVAAVRAGPVQGHGLALVVVGLLLVIVALVGHKDSSFHG
jgi:hypothetical protein